MNVLGRLFMLAVASVLTFLLAAAPPAGESVGGVPADECESLTRQAASADGWTAQVAVAAGAVERVLEFPDRDEGGSLRALGGAHQAAGVSHVADAVVDLVLERPMRGRQLLADLRASDASNALNKRGLPGEGAAIKALFTEVGDPSQLTAEELVQALSVWDPPPGDLSADAAAAGVLEPSDGPWASGWFLAAGWRIGAGVHPEYMKAAQSLISGASPTAGLYVLTLVSKRPAASGYVGEVAVGSRRCELIAWKVPSSWMVHAKGSSEAEWATVRRRVQHTLGAP